MSWKITAYCGNRCCNGKWAWQCSWSGHNNGELTEDDAWEVCAADKRYLRPGTIIHIGEPVNLDLEVVDTGGGVKGKHIDVFVGGDHDDAEEFGVKYADVTW